MMPGQILGTSPVILVYPYIKGLVLAEAGMEVSWNDLLCKKQNVWKAFSQSHYTFPSLCGWYRTTSCIDLFRELVLF